jgi:hypothetical protein
MKGIDNRALLQERDPEYQNGNKHADVDAVPAHPRSFVRKIALEAVEHVGGKRELDLQVFSLAQ